MFNLASVQSTYIRISNQLEKWVSPVSQLLVRFIAAKVFLSSGLSKWNGFFDFDENKYDLFMYEFFCPDPVRPHALQLCDSETLDYTDGSMMVSFIEALAVSAGITEVLFSLLLMLGLFSRFAALGLIGMTLFIQLAVFPSWDHWWNPAVWWFAALLTVFVYGPGKLSIDRLLKLETR